MNINQLLPLPEPIHPSHPEARSYTDQQLQQYALQAIEKERQACIDIIEQYRIPVGNSAAGEMACEWTYDALKEIRDEIKSRKIS